MAQDVPPVLQAMRQQDWATATADAGSPLGEKLVAFIRMLTPGQATASEILSFVTENPGWPDQDVLDRRYAEALADEPDEKRTASLCRAHPPQAVALLHCAEALALAGEQSRADALARAAWIGGLAEPSEEAAFLARWSSLPTQADQRRRFDHLEATDPRAADRQLARLDPDAARLAVARLAFRREDPAALSFLAAVPQILRDDPALLLAEARFLRRTHADQAALALWQAAMPKAEAATPQDRRGAFWVERDMLARRLLVAHDPQNAYMLVNDTTLAPDQAVEAEFLAGWIALRALQNPGLARGHFAALAEGARSAITQARAQYWLARASADPATAKAGFLRAAAWPFTYYGQLAARAAGETETALNARIAALRDPAPAPGQEARFAQTELARAAAILIDWQDPRRAADFLLRLAQDPAYRPLVAETALREGLPDVAVQTARLAGRDGMVLAQSGWPAPVQPPPGPVPPALVLGVIRQESSFDPRIVSAAGAHGLMQMMKVTAQQVAHSINQPAEPLSDPAVNMRLGTAYLASLLAQFGGSIPYAVAAYNAGPHRVHDWIATNGDAAPAPDPNVMIDWIESIPFTETRNYVQRVMESQVIYAAKSY